MLRLLKYTFSLFVIPFFVLFIQVDTTYAQACEDRQCNSSSDEDNKRCIQDKIVCLEGRLKEEQGKKANFTSAITVLNGQISIQQLQIQQTLNEINQLETQITDLSNRIEGLDVSLDRLTAIMMERVRSQYKKSKISPISVIADSSSLNEFVSQYKYVSAASQQTVEAMEKAENQKQVYDEQKTLKEDKQKEIEQKRAQLQGQQNELTAKKAEQQRFLNETQGNEKRFQELIEAANRELSSYGRFVESQGGASILNNQTVCNDWGCYYSQRDAQWGNLVIGNNTGGLTMAGYGCLVTSMAMVATHYDKDIRPDTIARIPSNFSYSTANLLNTINANGVSMTRYQDWSSNRISNMDAELAAGRPVIVRLNMSSGYFTHFIVIKEKRDGKYIMHDPFAPNGNDLVFTDRYSIGAISRVDRVTVN